MNPFINAFGKILQIALIIVNTQYVNKGVMC